MKIPTCKSCHGEGVRHTGIDEAPTTLCVKCDGSGNDSVAITARCELGEHCRCILGDQADCWNWIGKVVL